MAYKKKRKTTRKKGKRKATTKKRLAGYTKAGSKYALVFKKGRKVSVGKGRYSTKKSLMNAAKKHLK